MIDGLFVFFIFRQQDQKVIHEIWDRKCQKISTTRKQKKLMRDGGGEGEGAKLS